MLRPSIRAQKMILRWHPTNLASTNVLRPRHSIHGSLPRKFSTSPSYIFQLKTMEQYPVLKRCSRDQLAEWILPSADTAESSDTTTVPQKEKIAIIDVRDSDHIGGHIKSSQHHPSSTFSTSVHTLIPSLSSYDKVIFHCALSQQRGPSAALKYIRLKKELEERKRLASSEEDELLYKNVKGENQEVYVLDGGFVEWQEKYGEDKRLTEGWKKDIWENGYDY
ncbi:hypothetical protein TWF694_004703 [Orbilia ellipsospora]|uniref:Rhodanese domain-containing protein n=1 Tax=Orbilia ellipsospora TaxID=2528407 RepID=A0AAV9WX75_9PEZI